MSGYNLTPSESKLVIGLHRVVTEMDKETKRICKKAGLSLGQFMVLEALDHKGKLTVGEVKASALSTDGTIPVITGNLEKMGYITKNQDVKDKRKYLLEITEAGREIVNKVYPENNQMLREQMGIWSEEEKETLIKILTLKRKKA